MECDHGDYAVVVDLDDVDVHATRNGNGNESFLVEELLIRGLQLGHRWKRQVILGWIESENLDGGSDGGSCYRR